MGCRYILTVNCPFCNDEINDYYYAPTCGVDDFECSNCGKISFINNMILQKPEDVSAKELTDEFLNALNMWTPNKKEQKDIYNEMKKKIDDAKNQNLITECNEKGEK
jgi:hypothetical protein